MKLTSDQLRNIISGVISEAAKKKKPAAKKKPAKKSPAKKHAKKKAAPKLQATHDLASEVASLIFDQIDNLIRESFDPDALADAVHDVVQQSDAGEVAENFSDDEFANDVGMIFEEEHLKDLLGTVVDTAAQVATLIDDMLQEAAYDPNADDGDSYLDASADDEEEADPRDIEGPPSKARGFGTSSFKPGVTALGGPNPRKSAGRGKPSGEAERKARFKRGGPISNFD